MMCSFASGSKARERSQPRLPVRNLFHFRSTSVAQPKLEYVLPRHVFGFSPSHSNSNSAPHFLKLLPTHDSSHPKNSPQVIHDHRRTEREKYYRAEPHRAYSGNPRRERTSQAGPDL